MAGILYFRQNDILLLVEYTHKASIVTNLQTHRRKDEELRNNQENTKRMTSHKQFIIYKNKIRHELLYYV